MIHHVHDSNYLYTLSSSQPYVVFFGTVNFLLEFRGGTTYFSTNMSYMEGKYTEWPNPQITEKLACDRQSGLNDRAQRNHIPVV